MGTKDGLHWTGYKKAWADTSGAKMYTRNLERLHVDNTGQAFGKSNFLIFGSDCTMFRVFGEAKRVKMDLKWYLNRLRHY